MLVHPASRATRRRSCSEIPLHRQSSASSSLSFSPPLSEHFIDQGSSSSFRPNDITNEFQSSILPSRKQRTSTLIGKHFTFNKLRFDSVGLYGREKERSSLMERLSNITPSSMHIANATQTQAHNNNNGKHVYTENTKRLSWRSRSCSRLPNNVTPIEDAATQSRAHHNRTHNITDNTHGLIRNSSSRRRLCSSNGKQKSKAELVLLSGFSGTGKSKLASSIEKTVLKVDGIYGYGKFDLNASISKEEPYVGIAAACSQICRQLMIGASANYSNKNTRTKSAVATSAAATAVTKEVVQKLDDMELYLLASIIPDFKTFVAILKDTSTSTSTSTPSSPFDDAMSDKCSSANLLDTKAILLYAFRKFIGIVCNHFPPLVIVLDDMQWTDLASLELLQELLTDHEISNLMVIASYRSNEIDSTHILSKLICSLKQQQQQQQEEQQHNNSLGGSEGLTITDLHVGNIDVMAANQVIMALLNMDDKPNETIALAEICHKRTQGNVFFLLTFMEMLEQYKLLEFNLGRLSWTWNLKEIEKRTAATANVVDVLSSKMKNSASGSKMARLLLLAACLGSTFDKKILRLIYKEIDCFVESTTAIDGADRGTAVVIMDDNHLKHIYGGNYNLRTPAEFDQLLNDAISESFLEQVTMSNRSIRLREGNYRFVHDKVQEAAMSLLPQRQLQYLQYKVGLVLRQKLNERELDNLIFVVVNLLNSGSYIEEIHNPSLEERESQELSPRRPFSESFDIAELNLQAAEKAKSLSAFASSARYASMGLRLLPLGNYCHYDSYYKLCMNLYSTGAEAENCLGNTEKMIIYCNAALHLRNGSSSTILDKLRVYKVLMDYMGNNGRPEDAYHLCLEVLSKLGYNFPRDSITQSIAFIRSLLHLKSSSNKRIFTHEYISSIPIMSNQAMIECANLLDRAVLYCYLTKKLHIYPIIVSHLIKLTIRFGICDPSGHAFSAAGILLAHVLGDYKTASLYGELAIATVTRLQDLPSNSPSSTLYKVYMLQCFQNPLMQYENKFMDTYKKGLQCGDTESAGYSIRMCLALQLVGGKPLGPLEEDCRVYLPQMKALKREEASRMIVVCHQVALNLMGLSRDCTRLDGEVVDEVEFLNYAKSTQSGLTLANFKFVSQFLLAYLGEHELGAQLAIERGDKLIKEYPGVIISMQDPFLRGISLYAMARKKTISSKIRRKYMKHGNRARSAIRSMVKKGNPNVVHHLKLLDAEHKALKGKVEKASKLYYEAAILASRGGLIHDAAVCNERYSLFLLESKIKNSIQDAIIRMENAYKYYSEWGADAKLDKLREMHPDLLPSISTTLESRYN